jgi:hypothetical protein
LFDQVYWRLSAQICLELSDFARGAQRVNRTRHPRFIGLNGRPGVDEASELSSRAAGRAALADERVRRQEWG